jgi:hypothetical protein
MTTTADTIGIATTTTTTATMNHGTKERWNKTSIDLDGTSRTSICRARSPSSVSARAGTPMDAGRSRSCALGFKVQARAAG